MSNSKNLYSPPHLLAAWPCGEHDVERLARSYAVFVDITPHARSFVIALPDRLLDVLLVARRRRRRIVGSAQGCGQQAGQSGQEGMDQSSSRYHDVCVKHIPE